MRAISRRGHQIRGNRFASAPLHQALKNMSVKNYSYKGVRLEGDLVDDSLLPIRTARISRRSRIAKICEMTSVDSRTIEQLQESLTEIGAVLPMPQGAGVESALREKSVPPGVCGFSNVAPIEHPLVMAYITSCQQGNRMIYVGTQLANLGFTPEMWLGEADLRLQQAHEDDREQLAQALQHSLNTGEKFDCHYRLYDSGGEVRWFHDEASVALDEAGMPLFIRGVMLDITDQKEMEAELNGHRHSLERYVELRTDELMRRVALLESCNASLGNKLAQARSDLGALKQQSVLSVIQPDQIAQSIPAAQTIQPTRPIQAAQENNCNEPLDGISDWARNMIKWRVAAAGAIA
jgi:PAS domain S-box-containing protein